jgi:hypothetical protein
MPDDANPFGQHFGADDDNPFGKAPAPTAAPAPAPPPQPEQGVLGQTVRSYLGEEWDNAVGGAVSKLRTDATDWWRHVTSLTPPAPPSSLAGSVSDAYDNIVPGGLGPIVRDAANVAFSPINTAVHATIIRPIATAMSQLPTYAPATGNPFDGSFQLPKLLSKSAAERQWEGNLGSALLLLGPEAGPEAAPIAAPRPPPDYVTSAFLEPPKPGPYSTDADAEAAFHARETDPNPGGPGAPGARPAQPEMPPSPAEATPEPVVVGGARYTHEGEFQTTPQGHVVGEDGDPLTFGDQKAAAKWIVQTGQRNGAGQLFEIDNGATEGTFVVRERARVAPDPDPLPFVADSRFEPETTAEEEPAAATQTTEPPPAAEPAPGEDVAAPAPDASFFARAARRVRSMFGGEAAPEVADTTPALDFVQPMERQGALADAARLVDEKGIPGAVAQWLGKFYTGAVAEQHPLVRAVEQLRAGIEAETGRPLDINPTDDPRKLARGAFDVYNIGHMDLMHGVHPYRGVTPEGPALADVVAGVTARGVRAGVNPAGALKRFNDYLTARRGVEEWARFEAGELDKPPLPADRGGDRPNLERHIAAAEAAHPEYLQMADDVNEYGRALWTKMYDAGLISQQTYVGANAARNFYVPFRRVMGDAATIRGGAGAGKSSASMAFRGSDRDIVGPVESLAKQTYEVARRIRQNDINLGFVKLAEQLDELLQKVDPEAANGLIERVPEPARPITVSADELRSEGFDALFGDEAATVWRPGELHDGGRPIIYVWRDGVREAWEIKDPEWGGDIYNALTGMSKPLDDLAMRVLSAASSALRAGVTTNPEFLFTNFIRDQVSSWILTDVGFVPGEGIIGAADEVTGADVTRLYAASGGITGGQAVAGVRDAAIHADIMALRHKGFRATYLSDFHGLMSLSEITETGTRLSLFKRAFARAKAEGMSDADAAIEAAFTARDVLDFGRNGSRMAATRKVVTFLNASIQGIDKALRAAIGDPLSAAGRVEFQRLLAPLFERRPVDMRVEDATTLRVAYKLWAKIAVTAGLSLGLTALYADDPEFQNISEYSRATAWWFKIGDQWIAVPKPYELGVPANAAERAYEAMHYGDPIAWARLARGVYQTLVLPTDNPVIKTNLEIASNTNMATGGKIIPDEKLGMMPADQYAYWNSTFSKWLGRQVGASPAVIDHAVQGYSGSWGRWALGMSNFTDPDRPEATLADMPLARRFFPDWVRGSQDKTDFYNRVGSRTSELKQLLGSVQDRLESGRAGSARALVAAADPQAQVYVNSQLANGGLAKGLNPLSRAQVVGTETSRMIAELYGERPKGLARYSGGQDPDSELPALNAHQKAVVQDALDQLAVAEMRNAMILTHQPGFAGRAPMDRDSYVQQLEAASPGVAAAFQRRMTTGRERALDYHALVKLWPEAEERLRRDGPQADLLDLVGEAHGMGE